jgi:hypothetical protein
MIDKDGPIATPPSKAEIWNLLWFGSYENSWHRYQHAASAVKPGTPAQWH